MSTAWEQGSVPVYSIDLEHSTFAVAVGLADGWIDSTARAVKTWLSGPDARYGTPDDRRAFIRPAWEPNGRWYRWSPCNSSGGTATTYRNMWRRLHDRFAVQGIDRTRLAWIFSVNQRDSSSRCAVESLYPGHAYVDWVGVNAYMRTADQSPAVAVGPMVSRLRRLAPGKPLSIDEAGARTGSRPEKATWIEQYFEYLTTADIRMSTWFNKDKAFDWAVFGGTGGDEVFDDGTEVRRAWSAYRTGARGARMLGSDLTNPRLLTDAQFLGT